MVQWHLSCTWLTTYACIKTTHNISGRIYLKDRQCTVLAVARAHHDLQVGLGVALELWVRCSPSQKAQNTTVTNLQRQRKWFTVCTSSDKKAGSPMEAFAQGPMLSMLSQTCIKAQLRSFCHLPQRHKKQISLWDVLFWGVFFTSKE